MVFHFQSDSYLQALFEFVWNSVLFVHDWLWKCCLLVQIEYKLSITAFTQIPFSQTHVQRVKSNHVIGYCAWNCRKEKEHLSNEWNDSKTMYLYHIQKLNEPVTIINIIQSMSINLRTSVSLIVINNCVKYMNNAIDAGSMTTAMTKTNKKILPSISAGNMKFGLFCEWNER